MTDKELRRLKRTELLELMYYLKKELDDVKNENEVLRSQLESHEVGQAEINKKILETVRITAAQVEALCKANAIDDNVKLSVSEMSEEKPRTKKETE